MKRTDLLDFWHWWLGVLNEMASRHFPSTGRKNGDLIVRVTASGVTLGKAEIAESGVAQETFAAPELERRMTDLFGASIMRPRQCRVLLAKDRFILRKLSRHALPASELASAAELDLENQTPFARDQVQLLPVAAQDRSSSYAIVKSNILQPVLDAIQKNGCRVSRIDFETNDGAVQMAHFASLPVPQSWVRWKKHLVALCAASLLFGAGVTVVHAYARNQTAVFMLQHEIENLTNDAKTTRQALDAHAKSLAQVNALRKSIKDNEPVAGVWEELARVLPDSAYLTDFSVKGDQVSIAGFGVDAAGLIVALEQSHMFSQAAFTGPVTKAPGMDGERFEASFLVGAD